MNKKTIQKQTQVARQLGQIAWASPQVIAHRVTRMSLAGMKPSKRDQQEFNRMWTEKIFAFNQSWWAMMQQGWVWQQRMALQSMQMWGRMLTGAPISSQDLWKTWSENMMWAGLDMSRHGLTPVRRRAMSNARRLSRR